MSNDDRFARKSDLNQAVELRTSQYSTKQRQPEVDHLYSPALVESCLLRAKHEIQREYKQWQNRLITWEQDLSRREAILQMDSAAQRKTATASQQRHHAQQLVLGQQDSRAIGPGLSTRVANILSTTTDSARQPQDGRSSLRYGARQGAQKDPTGLIDAHQRFKQRGSFKKRDEPVSLRESLHRRHYVSRPSRRRKASPSQSDGERPDSSQTSLRETIPEGWPTDSGADQSEHALAPGHRYTKRQQVSPLAATLDGRSRRRRPVAVASHPDHNTREETIAGQQTDFAATSTGAALEEMLLQSTTIPDRAESPASTGQIGHRGRPSGYSPQLGQTMDRQTTATSTAERIKDHKASLTTRSQVQVSPFGSQSYRPHRRPQRAAEVHRQRVLAVLQSQQQSSRPRREVNV